MFLLYLKVRDHLYLYIKAKMLEMWTHVTFDLLESFIIQQTR